MAPVPPSTSPARGKSRVYLCRPCNVRHPAPTGVNCPIAKAVRARPSSSRVLGLKRSVARWSPALVATGSRPRGRPRKLPVSVLPGPSQSLTSTGPESDSDSLAEFVQDMARSDEQRSGSSLRPSVASQRRPPNSTPRQITPVAHHLSPSSSEISPRSPPAHQPPQASTSQDGTSLILSQLAAMQEVNRREFARIEAEARCERQKIQNATVTANVTMQSAIDQLQASLSKYTTPVLPVPTASLSNQPPRQPDGARNDTPATLEGQPPAPPITPRELAQDDDPITSLRRDDATSGVAAILLNDVGLVQAMDLENSSKKRGFSSKLNKLKRRAKWPNEYMFRLEDEDPQYDTLETYEFVSGYLSIIEEVTPINEANARLIRHLQYLRQLMDDCASLDWDSVRTAHRQVLMAIEYKRLRWEDTAAVKERPWLLLGYGVGLSSGNRPNQ